MDESLLTKELGEPQHQFYCKNIVEGVTDGVVGGTRWMEAMMEGKKWVGVGKWVVSPSFGVVCAPCVTDLDFEECTSWEPLPMSLSVMPCR